jgi:hypothetical protein
MNSYLKGENVGFVTKIQRVDRPTNQSFYAIIPSALAQAFDLDKGEEFEWIIEGAPQAHKGVLMN